jgi:hypothetical protein
MTDKVEPIIEEGWVVKFDNKTYYTEDGTFETKVITRASFFHSRDSAEKRFRNYDIEEILKVRRTIEIIKEGE